MELSFASQLAQSGVGLFGVGYDPQDASLSGMETSLFLHF